MHITVDLGDRSYPVIVEGGVSLTLQRQITKLRPNRVFMVLDAQLLALHGKAILRSLRKVGMPVIMLALPMNEKAKNQKTLSEIHDWLLSEKISRSDLIVACGGGVTTDLVGYAAATVLRGVAWGTVPTTLIGMIDGAIGGKTGINHPRAKNAIGAIWQPRFVYAHTRFLSTLDARQLYAGLGEMTKYAGLIGEPLVAITRTLIESGTVASTKKWEQAIAVSAAYKAALVSEDERDIGVRQYLNLGHTFAHGIEQALGYGKLMHGEAVSLGLLAAVNLSSQVIPGAESALRIYRELAESIVAHVPQCRVDATRVISAMQLDKKRRGREIRFVLLKRPGRPAIVTTPDMKQVRRALEEALEYHRGTGGRSVTNSRH